mmetsp:Transcript_11876/g.33851  ORF Transcript_11876/g.33851 Transcript_11876/m.33851 type:complete len:209 (+) Transcript_11876:324-950(+)
MSSGKSARPPGGRTRCPPCCGISPSGAGADPHRRRRLWHPAHVCLLVQRSLPTPTPAGQHEPPRPPAPPFPPLPRGAGRWLPILARKARPRCHNRRRRRRSRRRRRRRRLRRQHRRRRSQTLPRSPPPPLPPRVFWDRRRRRCPRIFLWRRAAPGATSTGRGGTAARSDPRVDRPQARDNAAAKWRSQKRGRLPQRHQRPPECSQRPP